MELLKILSFSLKVLMLGYKALFGYVIGFISFGVFDYLWLSVLIGLFAFLYDDVSKWIDSLDEITRFKSNFEKTMQGLTGGNNE